MILAMLGFAIEDSLIRLTSVTIPFGQVLFLFGFGGALIFALFSKMQKKKLFIKEVLSRPMIIRMFFELIGRLFYSLSLTLMPISLTTLILNVILSMVIFHLLNLKEYLPGSHAVQAEESAPFTEPA